jgi:hypothetical protein
MNEEEPVGAATEGHAARLTAGEPAPTATTNTTGHVVGLEFFLVCACPQLAHHQVFWALVIGGCSGVGLTFLSNKKTHQPENHLVVIKPNQTSSM